LAWQPAWRKTWYSVWKPIKVPAWKKIWTPVWISEWVPYPDHEEVWDRTANNGAAEKSGGAEAQQNADGPEDRTTRDTSDAASDTSRKTGFVFPQVAASAAAGKSAIDQKIASWAWQ
jgi:hypothetical protein